MPSILPIKRPTAAGAMLLTASILHAEAIGYVVGLSDGRVLRARRAKGCLVKPEAMDLVLAVDAGAEGIFIMAVLAGSKAATCLCVDGDLAMEAHGGRLSLTGRQVEVAPQEAATIQAPFVRIEGDEGRLRFRTLTLLSRLFSFSARRAAGVCERLDLTARHVFQRLNHLFRRIEGLEETRAGRVAVQARAGVDVRGGRVAVISNEDVKIDGRSVHIG